jgi:hypothetical protein
MGTRFHQKKIRRALFGFWALGIFALLPQRARAATEIAGATIEVKSAKGAENCPDSAALREQISALGTPRGSERAPLHVAVEFLSTGSGYRAIVRTSGRTDGTRELTAEGAGCEPLAAATAVFLAVLLDLLPASEAAAPPMETLAVPAELALSRENSAPKHSTRAPSLLRYTSVGAHLIAAYGLLGPNVSESFGGEARWRFGHVEPTLGGFAGPARNIDYPPGAVAVSLAAGHVGLCGYLDSEGDRLELGACAKLLLGELRASGTGFYEDKQASSFWIAGAIGATLALPLERHWALRVGLDAVIPFRQYTLEVERVGVVFDSSALGLALAFGPEFRFR